VGLIDLGCRSDQEACHAHNSLENQPDPIRMLNSLGWPCRERDDVASLTADQTCPPIGDRSCEPLTGEECFVSVCPC
jgi:hypothetical protein